MQAATGRFLVGDPLEMPEQFLKSRIAAGWIRTYNISEVCV